MTIAVFASSVAYGAAALALACRLYDSERLLGSDDAGLGLRAWLRHLLLGPKAAAAEPVPARDEAPTAGQALALYAFAWLVLLAFAPVQAWRLVPGLALFEWVGLLGLTAVYARGSGRRLASVLRLRMPSAAAVAGALLIGSSAWLVIGLLVEWVLPPPKEVIEGLRHVITPAAGQERIRVRAAADRGDARDLRGGAVPGADPARPAHATLGGRRRGADRSAVRPLPRQRLALHPHRRARASRCPRSRSPPIRSCRR